MCRIISIVNMKGGVGKSTTAVNLGIGLAKQGKKVLLLDCDSQGSLTASLGFRKPSLLEPSIATVMASIIEEDEIQNPILHHSEGVDLVPANETLKGVELALVNVMSRELILKEYVAGLRPRYDYILLDCAPSLGLITINALACADNVLIPVQAAKLALDGLQELIRTIRKIRRQINPDLTIEEVLITMVNPRTRYARETMEMLRNTYGDKIHIFRKYIPYTVRLEETPAEGVSIYRHDANGKAAEAYVQLSFFNHKSSMSEYEKVIRIKPKNDAFDDVRAEYAQMLQAQLAKGNNGLVRSKYITFSIEANTYQEAKPRLERIETDILNNFKVLGVTAYPLNGEERLKILYETFNPETENPFRFSYNQLMQTGLSTKDYVAPTSFVFKSGKMFTMGKTMGAASYLQILAPELTDKMLADFLDMDKSLIVNIHIQSLDQAKAIKLVKGKVTDINRMKIEEQKKAVRSGYDMDIIPSDLSTYGNDAHRLLEDLQSRNERMFLVTVLFLNTAKTRQDLENVVFQTAGIAQKFNCVLRRLDYLQEEGLMSSVPLGINLVPITRTLTTTATAIFVPFTTQELFMPGESLYLDYSDDDNPLGFKSDFILSLCELIMGSRNGIEAEEKSVIDRCLPIVYQKYLLDPVPENMPTLGDLYTTLRSQKEDQAQRIATALEIYVNGSLRVFNHQTNVELDNRIVCFDIKELGKQLKKIGMLIIQDQVWNRVTINREAHKSTRYYIDEFHLLLKEEQTAAYSVEIWKRFRKWGGIPTGITQNVKDLLASREIENIFENSDFLYMLNQAAGDRQILAKQLNISPYQLSYVTNSGEGEGLLFYGNIIIPFKDRFDRNTKLYALMTTKLFYFSDILVYSRSDVI